MEPLGFAASVPGAVDFGLGTGPVFLAGLVVALVPVVLVVRAALGRRAKAAKEPQLRIVEASSESGRRAA